MMATMMMMMVLFSCSLLHFHSLFPSEEQESKSLLKSLTLLKKIKLMGGCQGKGTSTPALKLNLKDSCTPSTKCHPCHCR